MVGKCYRCYWSFYKLHSDRLTEFHLPHHMGDVGRYECNFYASLLWIPFFVYEGMLFNRNWPSVLLSHVILWTFIANLLSKCSPFNCILEHEIFEWNVISNRVVIPLKIHISGLLSNMLFVDWIELRQTRFYIDEHIFVALK